MAVGLAIGDQAALAGDADLALDRMQVGPQDDVAGRDAQAAVLEAFLQDRGHAQLVRPGEQDPLDPARAMAALRVLDRLFAHAGLVDLGPDDPVTVEDVGQKRVLLGKADAAAGDHFARPEHVTDQLGHPDHEQVVPRGDVDADEAGSALIAVGLARALGFAAADQVVVEPGRRLVQPLQLVFLRPGILVGHALSQHVDVAFKALFNGLINVHHMPRPDRVLGRHQLVELVALAVRGADDPQLLPALGNDGEEGRPDLARLRMERELVEDHVGRKAARGVGVRRQGGDPAAIRKGHFHRLVDGVRTLLLRRAELGLLEDRLATLQDRVVDLVKRLGEGLDDLGHHLGRLPFAPAQNDPARAPILGPALKAVVGAFAPGREGLAGLPGEHADLEAAVIRDPRPLIGQEVDNRAQGGGHCTTPKSGSGTV